MHQICYANRKFGPQNPIKKTQTFKMADGGHTENGLNCDNSDVDCPAAVASLGGGGGPPRVTPSRGMTPYIYFAAEFSYHNSGKLKRWRGCGSGEDD